MVLRKENKSMKMIQIYKLDDSSRKGLYDEILILMNRQYVQPTSDVLCIKYIPLGITIHVNFDIFTGFLSLNNRVLYVQSEDLHFNAVFSDLNILSPERVLTLLEFLMDPYPNDENKRKLICDVIHHDLSNSMDYAMLLRMLHWIYNMNSFRILYESKEKQVNGDKYFISVTKMINEAGEYQLLAKTIQHVLHYDDKANLKIMIENVDPDPIIEWFTEYDVEKLPMIINIFITQKAMMGIFINTIYAPRTHIFSNLLLALPIKIMNLYIYYLLHQDRFCS
jgi:hypothetical protein